MATASVTKKLLDGVKAALVAGIGTGSGATHELASTNIAVGKLPWGSGKSFPAAIVTPVAELEGKGTNTTDDIGYGVQITIAQASDVDQDANADRLYYWREQAMSLFRRKRISGVSEIHTCAIEPRPTIDPTAFSDNIDATAFVVRAWQRKTRP